jgi:pimeloyl-ACP methyl ester carboxylesterase
VAATLVGAAIVVVAVAACSSPTREADLPSTQPGVTAAPRTTLAESATPGADDPTTAPSRRSPIADVAPLDWVPCDGGLRCSTLEVPLDHGRPDAATIELAVVGRAASSGAAQGIVVVNPGGPGGSGSRLLAAGYRLPGDLSAEFDLVSWDPRGVAPSTAVRCGDSEATRQWLTTDPVPVDDIGRRELADAARAMARHCDDTDGELLHHLSSADTVEDLHRLVLALGEPVHYLGLSYGTLVGQLHLEAHPGDLRSVVLDGVVAPDADLEALLSAQAEGFEAALDTLADRCASGALRCPHPEPTARFDALARQVASASVTDGGGRSLGSAELHTAVLFGLYDDRLWPGMLSALEAGLAGDPGPLLELADTYHSLADYATYAAVICTDLAPPDEDGFRAFADRLAARHPRFGTVLAHELLPCAFWPANADRQPGPAGATTVPTVLLSVRGDPATPVSLADSVADQLGVPHVVLDGDRHGAVGRDPCADAWLARMLLDPDDPTPTEVACGR